MITKQNVRLKTHEVLEHPWMKNTENHSSQLELNFNQLKSFQNYQKLKKITLSYIASQLSEIEIQELGQLFKK